MIDIDIFIKYFFIIVCSTLWYIKLQNLKFKDKKTIICLLFSIPLSLASAFTRNTFYYLTILLIVFCLFFILKFLYKKSIVSTIAITSISIAINYFTNLVFIFLCTPLYFLLYNNYGELVLNITTHLSVGILQLLFSFLIFRLKRLKKGIASFESKLTSDLGIFISLALLLVASFFNTGNKNSNATSAILTFCCIIIGILLFIWGQRHIKSSYLQRVHKRNLEILETTIAEQTIINTELKTQNEELSKIIHKDNKMIPAMEMAVEEILGCNSPDEQIQKSTQLLSQLKAMSSERKGILKNYENDNKRLKSTGVFSIDASLNYLFTRAKEKDINFNLSINADVTALTNIINENDLNTLILDLGENAIIATAETQKKNILIVFSMLNESICLDIFDSANHFAPSVLSNFGIRRITTRKKSGGSGIGLMTTFELMKKYDASFSVDETLENESYTKKVSVCFDRLNEYRVHTDRKEVKNKLKQRDDVVII